MRDRAGPVRGHHVALAVSVDAHEEESIWTGAGGMGGGRPHLIFTHPHGVVGVR